MAGRKTSGPALVEHLDGSVRAKERLELILQTVAGQVTVVAACKQLGISEAQFYKLRTRVLQSCLEDLEPKPRGRPPHPMTPAQQECEALSTELKQVRRELAAQTVRLEVAQTLPQVFKSADQESIKKTTRSRSRQPRPRVRRPTVD